MFFVLIDHLISGRSKRSPSKYDRTYDKFLSRHFSESDAKYLDKTAAYKDAQDEQDHDNNGDDGSDNEGKQHNADDVETDGYQFSYPSSHDYDRIRALSEKQVSELQKKPGNCNTYEKDGMICSTCKDPETGDTSESCAYSSQPKDKKVAFLKKNHYNSKIPDVVEETHYGTTQDDNDDADDDKGEEAVHVPEGPKPLKRIKYTNPKNEEEDSDYGAFKLAGYNYDVDDYDAPNAHLQAYKNAPQKTEYEIIPQDAFESKNLNQALTDFKSKDWSKCNKVKKGELTCYYCKDAFGANQEECMFVSASNPQKFKVARVETTSYDKNSRKPSASTIAPRSAALKLPPTTNQKERFARLRIGRPLVPTKATPKAEELYTPNPNTDRDNISSKNSKTIKRTVSFKKKVFDSNDEVKPAESRAMYFEHHISHV